MHPVDYELQKMTSTSYSLDWFVDQFSRETLTTAAAGNYRKRGFKICGKISCDEIIREKWNVLSAVNITEVNWRLRIRRCVTHLAHLQLQLKLLLLLLLQLCGVVAAIIYNRLLRLLILIYLDDRWVISLGYFYPSLGSPQRWLRSHCTVQRHSRNVTVSFTRRARGCIKCSTPFDLWPYMLFASLFLFNWTTDS